MIQGNMVALVTPMLADGSVDQAALCKLLDWHVEQGTDAIVSMGTTGESATLDEKEHCEVIRLTVEHIAGRIPVVAGTGANSTTEAINLTRCAAQSGADACLLVTPYYNKPTQEGLYLHHKAIAEAVDIPQILYNVPGRTACDMLPETVGRLAEIRNIVGVKEATGELERIGKIRALAGEAFAIYSGDDATGCESMLLGGNGVISVTANVAPALMSKLCKAALAGDRATAETIDAQLAGLHRDLFLESSPIPVKWVLAEMGMIQEGIRLPLTWLSAEYHQPLRQAMSQAGLL
ncbi:4-hydroxy-tetrahydrodipicolinate synthase [Thiolapillus sp.]